MYLTFIVSSCQYNSIPTIRNDYTHHSFFNYHVSFHTLVTICPKSYQLVLWLWHYIILSIKTSFPPPLTDHTPHSLSLSPTISHPSHHKPNKLPTCLCDGLIMSVSGELSASHNWVCWSGAGRPTMILRPHSGSGEDIQGGFMKASDTAYIP